MTQIPAHPRPNLIISPPAPTELVQNIAIASLPPSLHGHLHVAHGNAVPLAFNLENLDLMVTTLSRLGLTGSLPGALGQEAAAVEPGMSAAEKLLRNLMPERFQVLPLHQLATVEERSLQQALNSLQLNGTAQNSALRVLMEATVERLGTAIREFAGPDGLLTLTLNEVATAAMLSPAGRALTELPQLLAQPFRISTAAAANLERYLNRFISYRARRQELLERTKRDPQDAKPALPEYLWQLLRRVVVRILYGEQF